MKLALKEVRVPQGTSRVTVWEVRERLKPLPLVTYEGNEWLVIRVLFNKTDRKNYLDIRVFKKTIIEKDGKAIESFKITDKGIYLEMKTWMNCLTKIISLIKKYRQDR